MIPDVTPNGVFYLPPTGWLTSFYNPPYFRLAKNLNNLLSFRYRYHQQMLNQFLHSVR